MMNALAALAMADVYGVSLEIIKEQLKSKTSNIQLDNMKIVNEDLPLIVNQLKKNNLKSLSLKKNLITDVGIEKLSKSMSKVNVSVLDFSGNQLTF